MSKDFAVGQVWTYPHPEGFGESRIVIGAIDKVEDGDDIICIAVTSAPVPRRKGLVSRANIPFLPFSQTAIEETVLLQEGTQEIPEEFEQAYENWKADTNGRDFFQVPFPTLLSELYFALQDEDGMLNAKNE